VKVYQIRRFNRYGLDMSFQPYIAIQPVAELLAKALTEAADDETVYRASALPAADVPEVLPVQTRDLQKGMVIQHPKTKHWFQIQRVDVKWRGTRIWLEPPGPACVIRSNYLTVNVRTESLVNVCESETE
jgi:hypothetical protein